MYHSIYIGDKNTWVDWHLIPSTRPLVAPPKVKTAYVEIPGGDGTLDMTEFTGRPLYQDRTGSWEFYVDNEKPQTWYELYSEIMAYLHGRKFKIVLEDDPKFYYEGRLSVNTWKSEKDFSKITIDYTLKPYKYERWRDNDNWENPFDMSADKVVNDNLSVFHAVGTGLNLHVYAAKGEIPEIWSSMDNGILSVIYKGNTYPLRYSNNIIKQIVLDEGDNLLRFTSTSNSGHVKVHVIGGCL